MASGRVGGTRSKIRGQVGDVVYQVVRNADGTYTQISYGKAEDVTQTITPRLQAQRMCTCIVEALMRDLKPIATISMQSAANKSKSLNAFSSYNLQLVARDCRAYWNGGGQFYYPKTGMIGTPSEELGGAFMLSAGTWQYSGYDELFFTDHVERLWPYQWAFGKWFAGLRFSVQLGHETVGQFLKRHYMSPLDTVCFACFHDWYDWDVHPEDPWWYTRHSYIIAKVNTAIPQETVLTREVIQELFQCESDWDVKADLSDDGSNFYIGIMVDQSNNNEMIYTYGGFIISYLEGKKKISSSMFRKCGDWSDEYFAKSYPALVFGTWMGTPSVVPYPSPFL